MSKLIACFNRLGFTPDAREYEDRQRAQNIVYLLQLKGVKLGYEFNKKGIKLFSRDLNRELTKPKEEIENGELKK